MSNNYVIGFSKAEVKKIGKEKYLKKYMVKPVSNLLKIYRFRMLEKPNMKLNC